MKSILLYVRQNNRVYSVLDFIFFMIFRIAWEKMEIRKAPPYVLFENRFTVS